MKKFVFAALTLLMVATPMLVFAQVGSEVNTSQFPTYTNNTSNQYTNNPSNQPSANAGSSGSGQVTNPLGNINSICGLIKAILQGVIAIGIPIAVLFIVYAGLKFVLALGNPSKLQEARQNLMYTLIGIGIFLGAWLLAMVIANTVNALGQGSNGSQQIVQCN